MCIYNHFFLTHIFIYIYFLVFKISTNLFCRQFKLLTLKSIYGLKTGPTDATEIHRSGSVIIKTRKLKKNCKPQIQLEKPRRIRIKTRIFFLAERKTEKTIIKWYKTTNFLDLH
ncbi:hypothetical protein ACB098_10G154900 [Castanea mollissima]